jgi:hypothetical protein
MFFYFIFSDNHNFRKKYPTFKLKLNFNNLYTILEKFGKIKLAS